MINPQSEVAVSGSGAVRVPQRLPFDILDILRTLYRIDIQQLLYFVPENIDDLFKAAGRDLLADVHRAQSLGQFQPVYPPNQLASWCVTQQRKTHVRD